MANKGFAYGMSAQVAKKIAGKRDTDAEAKVQHFIETITGQSFDSSKSYEENLHDGQLICHLANKLKPKSVKKIQESTMPFKKMENIENFLKFAQDYGVPKGDLFQTVDLYETSNIPAFTATMVALGRACQLKPEWDSSSSSYQKDWPVLGPKPSIENKREFDEKTIAEGKNIIGIQAGTNKMASQAGQSFGARRQIN
ncbi:myophilin-like [Styela clava]|uniref:myophilin-like n=1 Tax=Styela clava TaxID=7725 RepID=UPI00193AB30C|nr:myophilin-like [Styela clava]